MDVRGEAAIRPAASIAIVGVGALCGQHIAPARPRLPQDMHSAGGALPAPFALMRRALARHSAAVIRLLASRPVAAPEAREPGMATAIPRGRGPATVLVVRGRDRADLIRRLDVVAARVSRLPEAGLHDFARELHAGRLGPGGNEHGGNRPGGNEPGSARAALVASDPLQAAALASRAAAILRTSGHRPVRAWPGGQPETRLTVPDARLSPPEARLPVPECIPAPAGVYVSEGARGRVALVFGGLACTSLDHSATLAASLATITAVQRLGVTGSVAVGYGLGEIIGLAWAGAITRGEAARLAAFRAEVLRPLAGRATMARIHADRKTVARLLDGVTGVSLAVDEGPRQQVVAGPVPSVRLLPYRAAGLDVPVRLLGAACGLHSAAMRPCVAPMAAVAAGTRFAVPARRLISSVTGIDFAISGDPAGLLAAQLERPAKLAAALLRAGAEADIALLATPDEELAAAAAACCRVPVIQPPLEADGRLAPDVLAALVTSGAIDRPQPFLPGPRPTGNGGNQPLRRVATRGAVSASEPAPGSELLVPVP